MGIENIVAVNIMSHTTWCHIPEGSSFVPDNSKLCEVLLECVIVSAVDISSAALWYLQVAVEGSTNLTNYTVGLLSYDTV